LASSDPRIRDGGRKKAPAALCRKVAIANLTGSQEIEIWGDGEQTRSFCHIDDCVRDLCMLMRSDHHEPINLGQNRIVSINQLADMIMAIAGVRATKKHVQGAQGVRGRNADISRIRSALGRKPQVSLEEGLALTYAWIEQQVRSDPEAAGILRPIGSTALRTRVGRYLVEAAPRDGHDQNGKNP
jgi:nucleoside-diphosphate-sugar epimerase